MRDHTDYPTAGEAAVRGGELNRLGDNLDALLLNLREAVGRVRSVANEVLGSEPEPALSGEKQAPSRSTLARLSVVSDEIASTIAELHSQIGRLEKL